MFWSGMLCYAMRGGHVHSREGPLLLYACARGQWEGLGKVGMDLKEYGSYGLSGLLYAYCIGMSTVLQVWLCGAVSVSR